MVWWPLVRAAGFLDQWTGAADDEWPTQGQIEEKTSRGVRYFPLSDGERVACGVEVRPTATVVVFRSWSAEKEDELCFDYQVSR